MDKKIKMLIGVFAVLVVAAFVFKGGITGNVASWYCSEVPEITNFEQVGDYIAVNWEDTAQYTGQARYHVALYKKEDEGYDFNNPIRESIKEKTYLSFANIKPGMHMIRIKAKNKRNCPEEYTDYATKEILMNP